MRVVGKKTSTNEENKNNTNFLKGTKQAWKSAGMHPVKGKQAILQHLRKWSKEWKRNTERKHTKCEKVEFYKEKEGI